MKIRGGEAVATEGVSSTPKQTMKRGMKTRTKGGGGPGMGLEVSRASLYPVPERGSPYSKTSRPAWVRAASTTGPRRAKPRATPLPLTASSRSPGRIPYSLSVASGSVR
jgi:hypothetical protein